MAHEKSMCTRELHVQGVTEKNFTGGHFMLKMTGIFCLEANEKQDCSKATKKKDFIIVVIRHLTSALR